MVSIVGFEVPESSLMTSKKRNIVIVKEDHISTEEAEKALHQFLSKPAISEQLSSDKYSRLKRLHLSLKDQEQ